jgi:hypothetical protein
MAADGQIRIRIGAVQDRSIETVFGGIEKRLGRLKDAAGKSLQGASSSSLAKPMQQAASAADKASRDIERSWNRELAQLNRIAKEQDKIYQRVQRDRIRSEEKAARDRVKLEQQANKEIARSFREAARDAEREQRRQERESERMSARQERARQRFAERTSWRATKFLFPPPIGAFGVARRVAGEIARGAGIDFSVEGATQRAISMQSSTIALANAERIATGQTRGAKAYDAIARSVGDQYSVGSDKVQELMTRFAALTGNYKDLDKVAPGLVSLAIASGTTDFGAVGSAAGMAFNQLKGSPGAIDSMFAVMRGTLGQAAEGAVDPADYAKHLGRIGAGAFKFQGDRGENILKLSALAQLAMERGATSPADAARSVSSFTNTFGKQARIKAFAKHGVDLFTDKSQSTFRDPFEIIKDSFRATNGNIPELSAMFMDVLGRKSIDSLGAVYKNAGGGEAGITAIQKEFDRYMGANLNKNVEAQNVKDYQESAAAKAAKFQNNLDRIASSLADKVLPAFERLAPIALQLADTFGGVVKFAAEHPGAAMVGAAGAAVIRGGVESAGRGALEQVILNGSTANPAGAVGLTGKLGAGVRIAGGGLAGAALGGAVGTMVGDTQMGSLIGAGAGAGMYFGPLGALAGAAIGGVADQGIKLWNELDSNQNEAARARARAEGRRFIEGGPSGALTPEQYDVMMKTAKSEGMLDPAAITRSLTDGLATQTLQVRVVNAADLKAAVVPPPASVDPAGRQPPPAPR